MEEPLVQLALIVVFGIGAQWIASRLRIPSILLLLLTGILAGPVFGLIDPDALLGEALFPFVSLAVGIIMFEGGLTLKLRELPESGPVILRLISVGALATWVVATLGSHFLLDLEWPMALLLGAILIVTGPTVVGPLLRQIRPRGRAGAILKWEGILIDPVGAITAVLVFETILLEELNLSPGFILLGLLESLLVGTVIGVVAAGLIIVLLRRFWVPDYLQSPVALMFVIAAFTLSDVLSPDSGLVAATVMGVALANQHRVPVRHIAEFKENLQVLLIGVLFILLAGRLDVGSITSLGWPVLAFVALLILLARPLTVLLSTLGSPVTRNERIFIAWLAPRGIVAASVASVFSFQLVEAGYEDAAVLVPVVFVVIIATVVFYGLTAGPVARRLGLAEVQPQGALLVGAHPFGRQLATALKDLGFRAVLMDTNRRLVTISRMEGLEAYHGSAVSEEALEAFEFGGIGRLLAMTSNDEVNSLAAIHFPEVFGRAEVYQLPPKTAADHKVTAPSDLRGRYLFGPNVTYPFLEELMQAGWQVKSTKLTPQFDFGAYQTHYNHMPVLLAYTNGQGRLAFVTPDADFGPRPGHTLVALVPPEVNHHDAG